MSGPGPGDCDRFREDLAAHADGALPAAANQGANQGASQALSAHLAGCPACAAELEGLRAADRALLAALGDDLLPRPGWLAGVEAKILASEGASEGASQGGSAGSGRQSGARGPWRVAALRVAAAVLAALAVGVGVLATRSPQQVAEQPVPSQRPAPRPEPAEALPGQPTPDPYEALAAEVLDAADEDALALEELLTPRNGDPASPVGPAPVPLQPGDQELLDDLEVLAYLAEAEELDLSEALELLEELAPEELDEG